MTYFSTSVFCVTESVAYQCLLADRFTSETQQRGIFHFALLFSILMLSRSCFKSFFHTDK